MSDFKEKLTDFLLGSFGIIWGIALMAFGIVQIWLGFIGIDYHLGNIFACFCIPHGNISIPNLQFQGY